MRVTADSTRLRVPDAPVRQDTAHYHWRCALLDAWKAHAEAHRLTTLVDQGLDPRQAVEQHRRKAEAAHFESRRGSVIFRETWDGFIAACGTKWSPRYRQVNVYLWQPGGAAKRLCNGRTRPAGSLAALMNGRLSDPTTDRVKTRLQHGALST
jgi:hypothetical protein